MCFGICFFLFSATEQTAQYSFRTPRNNSFLVCWPKITATPLLALYVFLWDHFDHPPSTTTVMAGMPWWKSCLSVANLCSSSPATIILSVRSSCMQSPKNRSVVQYNFLGIAGTFICAIEHVSDVAPPPAAICPNTAATFTTHCWCPSAAFTHLEDSMQNLLQHFVHFTTVSRLGQTAWFLHLKHTYCHIPHCEQKFLPIQIPSSPGLLSLIPAWKVDLWPQLELCRSSILLLLPF